MIDALLEALREAAAAALCVLALVGWWWETAGRREHERELWRREMRSKKPRR